MPDAIAPIAFDAEVAALLHACELPTADLPGATVLLGQYREAALSGVVGVERCGGLGLLRSLAVAEGCRGRGLGRQLVAAAEAHAAREGLAALYLLTTTAAAFFEALGYRQIPRAQAPEAIAVTAQLAQLCPATAALMVRELAS